MSSGGGGSPSGAPRRREARSRNNPGTSRQYCAKSYCFRAVTLMSKWSRTRSNPDRQADAVMLYLKLPNSIHQAKSDQPIIGGSPPAASRSCWASSAACPRPRPGCWGPGWNIAFMGLLPLSAVRRATPGASSILCLTWLVPGETLIADTA
jgi:hypothetical protein